MKKKKINNTSIIMNDSDYVCDRCGSDDNVRSISINYQMMLCRKCFNRRRKLGYGVFIGFAIFSILIFIVFTSVMIVMI